MTVKLIIRGLLAGAALAAGIAVFDAVAFGYYFGLQAMIIGVGGGAIMLLLALLMSLASYWLASRGRLAGFRRQLLAGAIFTGAAGMMCGFASAAVWFAAGHPWFP
ncbi:MAG TPA: hypothetical protein VNT75_31360 [Symbiobacteriaceae bacterium]|nr:hypothetical protein [Symbiobacteriaceae bacterium]